MAWLLQVTRKKRWSIWLLLLIQLLLAGAALFQTWMLKGLIDAAVSGNSGEFRARAFLLVGIMLAQLAMRAGLRFLREYSHASIENALKSRLFDCLLTRSFPEVTAVHSGEWMNRLTNDTTVVATGLSDIVPDVMGMILRLIGGIVLILIMIPQVAWVMVPGGLLLVFFTFLFRKKLKLLHKRIQEADGRLRVFLTDRLTSMLVVRSFVREEAAKAEGDCFMDSHKAARMKRNHFSNLCNVGFGLFVHGAYIGAAIYCGWGILKGFLSYGTFVATLQLVAQAQTPFANISGYLPRYYAMLASAERLREAEGFEEDLKEPRVDPSAIQSFYADEMQALSLQNASFSYPVREGEPQRRTLHEVNLRLSKGEITAVTGPSGCGKSTLLKLLMALYPLDEGERLLVNKDGEMALLTAAWRGLFAYVPQGNQLMSGTIREVVCFGDGTVSEEKVRESLHIACADFVEELPLDLDTPIGERGAGLSEGQLQRLAIARAICSEHPILLLDEATSSLDEATEQKLLENLETMTDRTVIIVTHRPGVLRICSQEIRMTEEGIRVRNLAEKG
ncbi:MAG: ABC transporter ATP-binding protein [Lachnospiraceae bacterium]|nr:ABC transporter ATP-binding protein [Lachnospiraceae bacterium]